MSAEDRHAVARGVGRTEAADRSARIGGWYALLAAVVSGAFTLAAALCSRSPAPPAWSGASVTVPAPTSAPTGVAVYVCAGGSACIKANISGAGRIYHFPGCPSYTRTHIDTSKGEGFFATSREAETAGFRRAATCPR